MRYPLIKNNITREDLDLVIDYLRQDDPILTNGPRVRDFEIAWSEWLGIKYSVFVNSGASANLLTLLALKALERKRRRILVPAFTWSSDINSIILAGFEPVFLDIDLKNLAMSVDQILSNLNDDVAAVFLTHALGFNGLDDRVINECEARSIRLIEDVCESHGAKYNNRKVGTFGWASNFSFYYAHHMSTIEGGMVCTNDEELYEMFRMIRSHGLVREIHSPILRAEWEQKFPDLNPNFIFAVPALNVRNTEIGGIIGCSQLKRLDRNIERRNENFFSLLSELDPKKYITNYDTEGASNYAFSVIISPNSTIPREHVFNRLKESGIDSRLGSVGGGNQLRQPYLRSALSENFWERFPVTDYIHFKGLYIGNHPELDAQDIKYIANVLNNI